VSSVVTLIPSLKVAPLEQDSLDEWRAPWVVGVPADHAIAAARELIRVR